METSTYEQVFEQIRKANRILIALPESASTDSVASGLGLKLFLSKLKKDAELVSSGALSSQLKFLPGVDAIASSLSGDKSLVVIVNTKARQLEELSYETLPDKASIFLKAKEGQFTPEDISFAKEKAPFDLVFVLDSASLADLGKLFEENTDVFYESPKINIDHKSENQLFGAVNLVDLTATSTGEVLSGLFEKFEEQLIDEDIATCLLAGIISKTESFQHIKTTPRSFLVASQLIALGGHQQEIIKALYKTKPLNFLKLWGRALAKLKIDDPHSLLYSVLNASDFEKSQNSLSELPLVLKELLESLVSYKVVAILGEGLADVEMILAIRQPFSTDGVWQKLGAGTENLEGLVSGYKVIRTRFDGLSLAEAENRLLEIARTV